MARSFPDQLAAFGIRLPLSVNPNEAGVVQDASGCEVLVVDVNSDRSDADAIAIAEILATAVNSASGVA